MELADQINDVNASPADVAGRLPDAARPGGDRAEAQLDVFGFAARSRIPQLGASPAGQTQAARTGRGPGGGVDTGHLSR
jgi:hypothetical protein